MKRGKPLKRTPFKQKRREGPTATKEQRPWARALVDSTVRGLTPGTYTGSTSGEVIEKEDALVCEAYRRLVRAMPCAFCGYPPPSQFCHGDMGKGMGLKTDDRTGWPGCGPRIERGESEPGCHHYVGTSGKLPKAERRRIESELAEKTRAEILRRGIWPHLLPQWKEV